MERQPPTTTPPTTPDERGALTWALHDLDHLLTRGVIAAETADALRRDYQARLEALDLLALAATAPPVIPLPAPGQSPDTSPDLSAAPTDTAATIAPHPIAARPSSPPLRAQKAPADHADRTSLWINLLLFLGAFFFVIASLIFVINQWRVLDASAKMLIMGGFTLAFLIGGIICRQLPRVRPAGQTFLAIGALLLPLDALGLYTFSLRDRGISAAATWTWGSLICALLYAALAWRRAGRVYAGAATIAASSAWCALLVALDLPRAWWGSGLGLLALLLLLAGRGLERSACGRAAAGPIPTWAAHLVTLAAWLATAFAAITTTERQATVAALGLLAFSAAFAAVTQPRPLPRALHASNGAFAVLLLGPALGWLLRIATHHYAIVALTGACLLLGLGTLLRHAGAAWRPGAIVVLLAGWVETGALLFNWSGLFGGGPGYWTLVYLGVVALCALYIRHYRQPWSVYPLALAGALALYFGLRFAGPLRAFGYAWTYILVAFAPVVVIQLLRGGGARRAWLRHLVVVCQGLLITAASYALVAGERFQTAAIFWLCVIASGALVAELRHTGLLLLPNLWGLGAIAATVALSGAGQRWAPSWYAATGLLLALALQGWRPIAPARRTPWFVAHRVMAGSWAVLGPLLAIVILGDALLTFLASLDLHNLVFAHAYGPAGFAVTLCGAALAADAFTTHRRPTGYSATAVLALTALMGIARLTQDNPQALAIPLGLYLLALSTYVAYEQDLGPARMPAANALLGSAIIVVLGTTLLQSLVHPWRYTFLGLTEGLLLVGITAFLRRRTGVALSLLFLTLTALRAVFDVARSLPNWAVIGLLGLLLLAAGVLFLLRRDRLEAWGSAALQRWSKLT